MILASLDTLAAPWLPPIGRVIAWGIASGALSMVIYAKLAPRQKILALKQNQQQSRRDMLRHEGDFKELSALIRKDLSLALRQIWLALGPLLLSVLPLGWLLLYLPELYDYPLMHIGPDWMRGFEFWYVSALAVASLLIKILFKIA